MTPIDHMSASRPTGSNAKTSGATNSGVPCIAWTFYGFIKMLSFYWLSDLIGQRTRSMESALIGSYFKSHGSIPKSHLWERPKSISLTAGAEPGGTVPGRHFQG